MIEVTKVSNESYKLYDAQNDLTFHVSPSDVVQITAFIAETELKDASND